MPIKKQLLLNFTALVIGILCVFAADIFLPLGMAVGFGYIILLIFAAFLLPRKYSLVLSALSSIFIFSDIFISGGPVNHIIIFNRFFAIVLVGLITFLVLRLRQIENTLKQNEFIEREHIESAVRESQARLAGIVSSAMDAIITVNSNQEIILFNKAAEKMFGFKEEEVKGRHLGLLIPQDQRDVHKKYVKNFGETGTTNRHMGALGAVRGLKKDGKEFPIEASISQIETNGQKLFTVILRDITERKLFEQEIQNSLKEKDTLLKEVHHRVKNNLQVISSLLNLQSEYIDDQRLLDFIEESQNRIKSMSLIHERLYESKVLSRIDLKTYITELAENLMESYQPKKDEVKLELDLETYEADIDSGVDLGLIINELLTNAFKYAFPKDFEGPKKITLKLSAENGKLHLRVSDTGIGIPESFNLQNANSLGLQLVDVLVSKLEGQFSYFVDKGTHIEIII